MVITTTQGNTSDKYSTMAATSQYSSSSGIPSSTIQAVVAHAAERTKEVLCRRRPWTELIDKNAFERPTSFPDALSRLKSNTSYFRVNYIIFFFVVIGLCLIWHPISLLVLAILLLAWIYLYFARSEPLLLFGRTISENNVVTFLGIMTIIGLFLTDAGSTLILGLVFGIVVMCLHASLRRTDDLFLDEHVSAI